MSHQSHHRSDGSHSIESPDNLSDPVRLPFLHAAFCVANEEFRRRDTGLKPLRQRRGSRPRGEAARLAVALQEYIAGLELDQLKAVRLNLAGNLLLELDRKVAGPGSPPGERLSRPLAVEPERASSNGSRVALVSLPWMSPAMPSIQLATLASALAQEGVETDVHEFYVDFAARIGLNLYNHISNLLGYVPEWVFSRHYYGPEQGDKLSTMIDQHPLDEGSPWPGYGDVILEALDPVTEEFLDYLDQSVDWKQYDIIGCSLTISQLGASMAFARRVKLRHPGVKIIFGGSQCAGPMGKAILKICPYVDVVVHVEGELVIGELVRRLRRGQAVEGLPGVSCRKDGEIVGGAHGDLYRADGERLPLCYDAYFRRILRLGLFEKVNPWLPFEGSRGCWYGQKIQCTFCGLHEIMEFRAWHADTVLSELERLFSRYGIGRFYAMDLILPREYLHTFLPEVARRGHNWMFFWEIKSNVKREELETLAAAGVRWIQPGIESLDTDLLRLMKKGVSALQNILLLKWCEELSIFSGWNLIFGLPGETQKSYDRMVEIIPKLFHLRPPTGGGQFQLHRFSPYFDHPEQFNLRWTGAHPMFKFAFPLPKHELDELVYLHEFELESNASEIDIGGAEAAVIAWRQAYERGATLLLKMNPDGSSQIEDTRRGKSFRRVYDLGVAETTLYLFLDAGVKENAVEQLFSGAYPGLAKTFTQPGGIEAIIKQWLAAEIVLATDGRIVGLALYPNRITRETGLSRKTIDSILTRERSREAELGLQSISH